MNPFRKQTRLWTMKDGEKIRICDMADSHLENSIAMLDRALRRLQRDMPYPEFQGDMAQYYAELDWDRLQESVPEDQYPIYGNLVEDRERRKWDNRRGL